MWPMKKVLGIVLLCILLNGCAQMVNQNKTSLSFYFTDKLGAIYEYNGNVKKISQNNAQSISFIPMDHLQISMRSSVQIFNRFGPIVLHSDPDQIIKSAVVSASLDTIYFTNNSGTLYKKIGGNVMDLNVRLYPSPTKMILDEEKSMIYYHDNLQVFELNLLTLQSRPVSNGFYPIHSIAYNNQTDMVYFSTSIDGKIYKIDLNKSVTDVFLATRSANGSAISLGLSKSELYYTRTNGKDTFINGIDTQDGTVTNYLTLFNVTYVDSLAIQSE